MISSSISKMKSSVVTGANGFVGYWLIRELSKHGVKVTAVIKDENEDISMLSEFDNVNIVYCDLSQLKSLPNIIGNVWEKEELMILWFSKVQIPPVI